MGITWHVGMGATSNKCVTWHVGMRATSNKCVTWHVGMSATSSGKISFIMPACKYNVVTKGTVTKGPADTIW